jgi:hypothetical protein
MSQIVKLFANLDKHKPSLGDSVPNSPSGQRECNRRARNPEPLSAAAYNGILAGALIWCGILALLAWMASS